MPKQPDRTEIPLQFWATNFITIYHDLAKGGAVMRNGISLAELQSIDTTRSDTYFTEITFVFTPRVANQAVATESGSPLSYAHVALAEIENEAVLIIAVAHMGGEDGYAQPDAAVVLLDSVYVASTIDDVTPESRCLFAQGDKPGLDEATCFDQIGCQAYLMRPGTQLLFRLPGFSTCHLLEMT